MTSSSPVGLDAFLEANRYRSAYFGVRLRRGETLYGSFFWPLPGDAGKDLLQRGRRVLQAGTEIPNADGDSIHLYTVDVGAAVHEFKVPRDDIDSMLVAPEFDDPVIETPDHPHIVAHGTVGTFRTDLRRLMLDHTARAIKRASVKHRKVVDIDYVHSYPHPAIFPVWLPVKPEGLFPVYFDQDHLASDTGWSVLERPIRPITTLLKERAFLPDVVTAGILSFFSPPTIISMEGHEWHLCAITPQYVASGKLSVEGTWLLAAVKARWLMNAVEVLERVGEPYRITGDLLPVAAELPGYGTKLTLFRVRAAAHLPFRSRGRLGAGATTVAFTAGARGPSAAPLRTSRIDILFVASDPCDAVRLRIDQEYRDIAERLEAARLSCFAIEPCLAARATDLSQALLKRTFQIVHFSGHGTRSGGLCFENSRGETQVVDPEALAELFGLFGQHVICVVLNACFSETQARAIARHIDYVIGTPRRSRTSPPSPSRSASTRRSEQGAPWNKRSSSRWSTCAFRASTAPTLPCSSARARRCRRAARTHLLGCRAVKLSNGIDTDERAIVRARTTSPQPPGLRGEERGGDVLVEALEAAHGVGLMPLAA
jgi:hypothetical protein